MDRDANKHEIFRQDEQDFSKQQKKPTRAKNAAEASRFGTAPQAHTAGERKLLPQKFLQTSRQFLQIPDLTLPNHQHAPPLLF
jgi:hypothetical protein